MLNTHQSCTITGLWTVCILVFDNSICFRSTVNIEEEPTDLGLLATGNHQHCTSSRKNVTKILSTLIKQKHNLTSSTLELKVQKTHNKF